MSVKYIFITGGVVSGLGKGITASALGRLLKARGYKVTIQKFDPYINIDPGTMNPVQHGEVFVTEDGAETDLDLGHYERFIDENLNKNSNVTTGKIYWDLLQKERRGEYQGNTVQVVPHVTNEIKKKFYKQKEDVDIAIIEVGGTVGDIESQPFFEAIRQFQHEVGKENSILIHVTLLVHLKSSGELKTKPTQMSVKTLQSLGLQPDLLVCRSDLPIDAGIRNKIALFCNVEANRVIENLDVDILYSIVLDLEKQGFADEVLELLHLPKTIADLSEWKEMINHWRSPRYQVRIALVGKYISLHDSYLSVVEALKHAGIPERIAVEIKWIDSEQLSKDTVDQVFAGVDGIILPGGFGNRGIAGMIEAIRYVRENKIPFLGICLGMQLSVVEYARHEVGLEDAHSTEFNSKTINPVIHIMSEQEGVEDLGGTLRLGSYECLLDKHSKAFKLYQQELITERHRHRYEVNNTYRDLLQEKKLKIVGTSPDKTIVEMIELEDHPFFLATQAHPEFKSRPNRAHPLFRGLVESALEYKKKAH